MKAVRIGKIGIFALALGGTASGRYLSPEPMPSLTT